MRTSELLCFGSAPNTGNPAFVIEDGPKDPAARQALAREHRKTVVFIDDVGDRPVLDYWYPHARSPLCMHATLAVAHELFARHQGRSVLTVATAVTGQSLVLSRQGEDFYIEVRVQGAPDIPALPDLAALLRLPGFQPASPPAVASVGSPKLLIEVANQHELQALRPDLLAITEWGKAHGVNGFYVWCRDVDGICEGRNFNHLDPAAEDSATGVAAGALTALLGRGITLRQGRATGRECVMRTRLEGDAILIGGRVQPLLS